MLGNTGKKIFALGLTVMIILSALTSGFITTQADGNETDMKYSMQDGMVIFEPKAEQIEMLMENVGANGKLRIEIAEKPEADDMKEIVSGVFKMDLKKLLSGKGIREVTFAFHGMEACFRIQSIEKLSLMAEKIQIKLTSGSMTFALNDADGKPVPYYDYETPVVVSMQYTPPQDINTNYLVLYDDRGAEEPKHLIPRSWYADGAVHAKIYAAGQFDVQNMGEGGFEDMSAHWAKTAVDYTTAHGVTTGVGQGIYQPEETVTRMEYVTMLMRTLDIEPQGAWMPAPFADQADIPEWAVRQALIARILGMSVSDENDNFNPNQPVKRQEMFLLGYEALGICNLLPPMYTAQWIVYSDWDGVSPEASSAIQNLSKLLLVKGNGDGTLKPTHSVTRAEAAQFIYGMLQYDIDR